MEPWIATVIEEAKREVASWPEEKRRFIREQIDEFYGQKGIRTNAIQAA